MGRKGARLTEQATETAERLSAELAPLGEIESRKMFGGYGIYAGSVSVSVPGWPDPTDLLGPATRALEAARAAKA